ncbi:MAG: Smr/MutS family protein, partial [Spirochaetales bacterium]|nr:Smr/MutS family protein [Spirochaetales bacterium]
DGNVSSKASPELFRIRQELSRIDDSIMRQANDILADLRKKNMLMTDSVTLRDGLPCVGVKPSYKRAVPGMVAAASATGQTIFIVPESVLQIYNDGRLLREQEIAEIHRILKSYCRKIADQADILLLINDEMIRFDVVNAKAKWTIAHDYSVPKVTNDNRISIINGRNPFLVGEVVPLDLEIGYDYNTLIITGPNTGGKTVALKTTGLCTLMSQWGLGIPADSQSHFGVFENICVDIGDDQSIEASLSTFSSHIKNLKEIIERTDNANGHSLVLIDELGTGTDPSEGEALAISIIRNLRDKNVISVVTSHFNGLKYFAAQEEHITNGAMDFDSEQQRPTYRLKVGIPGSSKAIEISQHLGMPASIIEDAKSILSHGFFQIDKIIENLNIQQAQLDKMTAECQEATAKAERKFADYQQKLAAAKEKEHQYLTLMNDKKRDYLKNIRREFEHLVKNIKTNSADKESVTAAKDFIQNLERNVENAAENVKHHQVKKEKVDNCVNIQLSVGDAVRIISKDIKGTVIDTANKSKNGIASYLIQAGIIKIKVNADDLQKMEQPKVVPTPPKKVVSFVPDVQSMTLDLRGCRVDEAERKLDDFIEAGMLNNYGELRSIHGMGTGALREFVAQYLKMNSFVTDYGYEKDAGGGLNYGVTEVKLR